MRRLHFHTGRPGARRVLRRGFTVLELLAVMTLTAALFAIAVPRFGAFRDAAAVRAATADLGAALSLARQTAITRRAAVAVVFDPAAGVVELRSRGRLVTRRSLLAVYGTALAANRDSAVYDPRGLGFGLSNVSVIVRRGSAADTLTMSRLGRVRW